jgi:hypothetical protein
MTTSDEDDRKPLELYKPDKKPTTGFAAYLVILNPTIHGPDILTNSIAFLHIR